MPRSCGAHVTSSARFQLRLDGSAPTSTVPQRMPIIAENSYALSAEARLQPVR